MTSQHKGGSGESEIEEVLHSNQYQHRIFSGSCGIAIPHIPLLPTQFWAFQSIVFV
jgi:hypothetical protein